MKILILGRPRTRSTLLINTLSKFYGLSDKDENFKFILGKFNNTNFKDLDYFKNSVKIFTQTLFSGDNFAIKLFPRMVTLSNRRIDNLKTYKLSIINDLSYYYNLKKYDQIFVIDRNLIDSVYSYAYGSKINVFNFRDKTLLKEYLSKCEPIHIDFNNNPYLKFYVYERAMLDVWKEYLIKYNIKHTCLDYDNIPNYIEINFPNMPALTLDNTFDYKNLISNYENCQTQILEFYEECRELTKQLTFT